MTEDTEEREPPTEDAEALVEKAAEAGYDLDFTPESLVVLDSLVEDLTEEGKEAFGLLIVAYVGEVFVRNYEAEWTYSDQMGWLVDLSSASTRDDMNLFSLPEVTAAVVNGEETFASVHDRTVAGMSIDGPALSDDSPLPQDPEGEPLGEDARQEYRERAEELVADRPEYDLDYSPASLAAVDDLIADHYDRTPEDVDRAERLSEAPLASLPDDAEVPIDTGPETTRLAAYVGEVFRRSYDARWYGGEFDTIVIETAEQPFEFDPELGVNAAYHGWASFERLHETLAEHGLGEE